MYIPWYPCIYMCVIMKKFRLFAPMKKSEYWKSIQIATTTNHLPTHFRSSNCNITIQLHQISHDQKTPKECFPIGVSALQLTIAPHQLECLWRLCVVFLGQKGFCKKIITKFQHKYCFTNLCLSACWFKDLPFPFLYLAFVVRATLLQQSLNSQQIAQSSPKNWEMPMSEVSRRRIKEVRRNNAI